jgi:mRNA-degrading endonuclease HigB of HigAB toxin-antitoxin module
MNQIMKTTIKNISLVLIVLFSWAGMAQQPALPPVPSGANNVSSSNSAIVRANLEVINNAFQAYNSYNTVFSLEGNTLRWKSSVADITGDINDLIFYINYANKWIVIKCLKDECMDGTSYNSEYSMSLKTPSGNISPDMERVLTALNAIRGEVLRQ